MSGGNVVDTTTTTLQEETEHPLADDWFWHFGGRYKGGEFEISRLDIFKVDSIERFWKSFNAIPSILTLGAKKTNLYLFKKRVIQPLMEDPMNVGGGRWVIEHSQMINETNDPYKQTWKEACMFVIGNNMPERLSDSINGIVCNYQAFSKKFRFELWIKPITPALSKEEMKELEVLFMSALEKLGARMNKASLQYKPHT